MATGEAVHRPGPADVGYELVLTRTFDAPRDLVFKAWTEPERLTAWWGPHGFTNPHCEVDARPGGAMRIGMRAPDGAMHPMAAVFEEVAEPERLVFTGGALDAEGRPLFEVRHTVTFAEDGRGTILTLRARVVIATPAAAPLLPGAKEGWTQCLERLAAYLHD